MKNKMKLVAKSAAQSINIGGGDNGAWRQRRKPSWQSSAWRRRGVIEK
jgi:hypothetical protein